MKPRIIELLDKKLVGIHKTMSLTNNTTGELWRSFMFRRNEILARVRIEHYSLQVYPKGYFEPFDPTKEFEKWALDEVSDFNSIPLGMERFMLSGGLYAVFDYKGLNTDTAIFQYIYGAWLPNSEYVLDDRPHFEVLGEKYKNNDPNSEEEIWIPVVKK